MSGQQDALAALYPRERPGTHFTGGWVGPRAALEGRKNSSPPGFDPGPSSPSLYRLSYPAHKLSLLHCVFFRWHDPSGLTMILELTRPLTEISTRNILPVRRADKLTAFMCWFSWNVGIPVSWNPQGLFSPVMGLLYLFTPYVRHMDFGCPVFVLTPRCAPEFAQIKVRWFKVFEKFLRIKCLIYSGLFPVFNEK